jgi:hypothetical protein
LCENTPPFGRRVSTQFLVFPISTRVDVTVYQHGKCFIFVKHELVVRARQLDSVAQLVRAMHRNLRFDSLGLINVFKFTLNSFHPQNTWDNNNSYVVVLHSNK